MKKLTANLKSQRLTKCEGINDWKKDSSSKHVSIDDWPISPHEGTFKFFTFQLTWIDAAGSGELEKGKDKSRNGHKQQQYGNKYIPWVLHLILSGTH